MDISLDLSLEEAIKTALRSPVVQKKHKSPGTVLLTLFVNEFAVVICWHTFGLSVLNVSQEFL